MPFDPEDSKWTAYVLNELDADERVHVEQELAESAEARQLVAEIRETTRLLEGDLQAEPLIALSAEQRMAIEHRAQPKVELPPKQWRVLPKTLAEWVVVATVLVMLAGLLLPATQRARESARLGDVEFTGGQSSRYGSYNQTSPQSSIRTQGRAYTVVKPVWETKTRDSAYTVCKPEYEKRIKSSLSRNRFKNGEGESLPSGYYLQDDIQYFSPGPEFKLSKESREMLEASRIKALEDQIEERRTERVLVEESYDPIIDNPFLPVGESPVSTFSIDVDTASYSNIRCFLTQNHQLPPKGAVRIEEMINYFRYDYPQPEGDVPFSVTTEVGGCPWNVKHRLVRIGLKGREIAQQKRPPSNLVFLLDVSGSMSDANKLPLVREAMKLLTEQLTENDRVAIVVYAGSSGMVLPSTTGDKQQAIREAISRLEAGGSTNGGEGIQLAYDMAAGNFIKGGTNRVILATDGDFNVGITDHDDLIKLITEKAKSGVFLTTLGFGMGNLKDSTLEQLADKGNGNYAYIDDLREARKVFVEQMNGTLITIAKDVKIQIEFNPAEVAAFRLIGYENRILNHEDFNDDKKDAGEIGAGHTVTALYEVVPVAEAKTTDERTVVDALKYQRTSVLTEAAAKQGELLTLKLRYKQPDGDVSKLIEVPVIDGRQPYGKATADFKFAASVALFGMILRDSPYKGTGTIDAAAELAGEGLGADLGGYRAEFVDLIKRAKDIGRR